MRLWWNVSLVGWQGWRTESIDWLTLDERGMRRERSAVRQRRRSGGWMAEVWCGRRMESRSQLSREMRLCPRLIRYKMRWLRCGLDGVCIRRKRGLMSGREVQRQS